MLPLIRLPECPHCGTKNQGTRAKAGNSVRCTGCDTMRRVPMDRRTYGDDDPRATRPVRGKPLQPGHPYRFQPGNTSGPAGKPRTGPATTQQRQAPASGMDTLRELLTRLGKNPETPLRLTTEIGDGSDCMEVVRLAAAFDKKYPHVGLYWEASKDWKSVRFWIERDQSAPAAPTRARVNTPNQSGAPRLNQNQPPRRMPNQSRPTVTPKPNYVNPDTCPHHHATYDHMADAFRCPDCSYAWPAWA